MEELEQGATAEVVAEQVENTESVTETSEPKTLEDALWSDGDTKSEGEQPAAETKEVDKKPEADAEKTVEESEDDYAPPEGLSEKANVRSPPNRRLRNQRDERIDHWRGSPPHRRLRKSEASTFL